MRALFSIAATVLCTVLFYVGYWEGKRTADKWYADKTRFELVDCSTRKKLSFVLSTACIGFLESDELDHFVWLQKPVELKYCDAYHFAVPQSEEHINPDWYNLDDKTDCVDGGPGAWRYNSLGNRRTLKVNGPTHEGQICSLEAQR